MANSIFQGDVLPDVNTTKTSATTAPQFFTDYLSGIAGAGQTALGKPADQLVAGMQPLQTQGYEAVPAAAEAYKPGLAAAGQTAASAAGVNEADINQFMNPYTKNVVDEMARLSQQSMQRNLLPTMKAGFVGSGGLGSQRYASALGQGLADTQANLTGQQYGALSAGYKSAVDQAIQNAQAQNLAAKTQADIAAQEQNLGLTGAGALTKAGAEQQAFEQSKIDAPLKNASNAAALLRNYNVPTSVTENYKGPMAGVYGTSPLATLTSLLSLVGSGTADTTKTTIDPVTGKPVTTTTPGWMTGALDKIGTLLKSSGVTDGFGGTSSPEIDLSWLKNIGVNDKSYTSSDGSIIGTGTAVGEGE